MRSAAPPSRSERDRLVRKLESIGDMSADEKAAIYELPTQVRTLTDGEDIVLEGERPTQCCLILTGFVCRYKLLPDGRRQIFSFHTPGDFPDLQSLHVKTMDHSVATLAESRLGFIEHTYLHELIRRFPDLGSLLWRDTLIDAAIFREWMVGIGRRSAHQRIAHLLCEMALRFEAVGLTHDHNYQFPITQVEMGDALGLTDVHVNRILRSLREEQLVITDRAGVRILDWEGLKALGEFDPTYLHQTKGTSP
jgi:CRP-like cAMP-binding protein